jgi:hypothetical protein
MEEFARLITPLPPVQMRPAAPASSPRLPVRLSPNFQASTAAIGAKASSSTELLRMSAFHGIAAVPLCRSGYFVADMIASFEL